MMRVLYFTSLFPCWSETFIVREILALMRLGVDVRIVSLKHPCEAMVQSDAQGLLDRVIYPVAGYHAWAALLRHPVRELGALFRIAWALKSHPLALLKSVVVWWRTLALLPTLQALNVDHLHAHWATYPSTSAWLAAQRLHKPYSFTAHAHDIFLEDHLLLEKMRTAAFGVTISEFNRQYLAEHVSPMALQCMRIVHCGVVPADFVFAPTGREPGVIVAVGRLDEIKGFVHLIDACALLRARGVAFTCQVIGEGPLREVLRQRITGHGLGEQVQLLGAQKQEVVRAHLGRASVFVLPCVVTPKGDRDGIPVAMMEAMACGLPVVSTRVSGIPELVEHGQCGWLAQPGDALDLSRCIEAALTDPLRAKQMARRAREVVERSFDVSAQTQLLLDAMRGVHA